MPLTLCIPEKNLDIKNNGKDRYGWHWIHLTPIHRLPQSSINFSTQKDLKFISLPEPVENVQGGSSPALGMAPDEPVIEFGLLFVLSVPIGRRRNGVSPTTDDVGWLSSFGDGGLLTDGVAIGPNCCWPDCEPSSAFVQNKIKT